MIKKIILILAGIIIALALIGFLLPRNAHVERSIRIDRPASMVYATVNSFALFPQWSPWQHLDSNMVQTSEGPREGVGAKLTWSGNDKIGTGTQLITASIPNQSVRSDLSFGAMGTSKAALILAAAGSATTVKWTLDSDMGFGPIGRYFGLLMDSMVGKDFDSGLRNLKSLVESMPNADIAGFTVEIVDLNPQSALPATGTGYAGKALKATHVGPDDTLDQTGEKLIAYAAAHGYESNGPRFSVRVDDPVSTPPEKRRSEVYWPVK